MPSLLALVPWQYRIVAYIALALALTGFGFVKGLDYAAGQVAKAERTALQSVIATERKHVAQVASAAASHEVKRAETRVVYRTIEKEVIRYVQSAPPNCQLPAGWVRLHDAAALSAVPAAPGESDAQPSGFTDVDGLVAVVGNYEACAETRQQLVDLQAWLRSIASGYQPE